MRMIWKHHLNIGPTQIMMPEGAEVLCVQVQYDRALLREGIFLWALVDPGAKLERRDFLVYGTGQPLNDDAGKYIGTFQLLSGGFVGHVFEV